MFDCPFILKKRKEGISITELLIVVTIIAVLMVVFMAAFKPWTQQAKARDSRRKSDLQKLKNPLEDYYNDNNCYPELLDDLKPDYIGEVPKDPDTGVPYQYDGDEDCKWYRVYVTLEFTADSEIVEVGCGAGCGPEGDSQTDPDIKCAFNYGVSSPGVGLECCIGKCAEGTPWIPDYCEAPGEYCFGEPGQCCPGLMIMTCYPDQYWCCPPEE